MPFDDSTKKRLAGRWEERVKAERGSLPTCPICTHPNWQFVDTYVKNMLGDDLRSLSIGGPSLPTIAVACKNCGFVAQFSLGILGLFPERADESAPVADAEPGVANDSEAQA